MDNPESFLDNTHSTMPKENVTSIDLSGQFMHSFHMKGPTSRGVERKEEKKKKKKKESSLSHDFKADFRLQISSG